MSYNEEVLIHEGVGHDDNPPGRGSGRWAWGSGENPYQHQFNFQSEVRRLRKNGFKDKEIAEMLLGEGKTTTDLRIEIGLAEKAERQYKTSEALKVLEQCDGNKLQAAKRMGIPPSSFYKLVDPTLSERTDKYENTANYLKNRIEKEGRPIDISPGTEISLNVTKDTMKMAVAMLEKEGYIKGYIEVPQQTNRDKKTRTTCLAPPGTDYNEVTYANGKVYNYFSWRQDGIGTIEDYSPDQGKTFWTPEFPASLDRKRIYVRYAEDGGKDKDGVMEIRKGVEDLSLGNAQYAQLRVLVDGSRYMKGMAVYSDEVPPGYDVIYNTNKKRGASDESVFKSVKVKADLDAVAERTGMSKEELNKKIKDHHISVETVDDLVDCGFSRKEAESYIDKDNPFGALIKAGGQYKYKNKKGEEVLSPVNKLREEGEWDEWARNLSSQFLSKQPEKLIKQQLDMSVAAKQHELDQIKALTNPVIKQSLLEDFAANCDKNAADLSAKGFKNQAFKVILPVTTLKDNEIYAPSLPDGEEIALVRYPHGGIFEIPILRNTKRNENAKSVIGNSIDGVGINAKVAEKLSGADFDGDTVLCIPMSSNRLSIAHMDSLSQLEGFDTKMYKVEGNKKTINNSTKQNEMGKVTNLIADMTVQGATTNAIAKAVKHSMVIIDSEKHNLDWKRSMQENDIIALKKEWQGVNSRGQAKGASTILTKANSEVRIPQRKIVNDTSIMTPAELAIYRGGGVVYRDTGKTRWDSKKQQYVLKEQKVHRMDTVSDAFDLVRDKSNGKEVAYANYANSLKSLANDARRTSRAIKPINVSQSAKKAYAAEVKSLNEKIQKAEANRPRERAAQRIADAITSEKFKSNPDMDYEHKQKESQRALTQARAMVGASRYEIKIEPREWEAIQANAITTNKLKKIILHTDQDKFRQLATPRRSSTTALTTSELNYAKALYNSGMYTLAEIADALKVSTSTISKAVKE